MEKKGRQIGSRGGKERKREVKLRWQGKESKGKERKRKERGSRGERERKQEVQQERKKDGEVRIKERGET